MTRPVLLVLAFTATVTAAPIPEAEAERLAVARVYGTWTDPVGDCTYRAAGGRLHVRLPAFPRGGPEYTPGPIQAPRFVHVIDGDFTATVRADVPPQPDDRLGLQNPGGSRFVAAGLTAEDAGGNRAGVRKFEKMDGGHRTTYGAAWRRANGGGGGMGTGGQKDGPTRMFLRLARAGSTVVFAVSPDGAAWREYGRQDVGWAGPVTLGLVAENTTGVPAEVTFDRFTLTRAKN